MGRNPWERLFISSLTIFAVVLNSGLWTLYIPYFTSQHIPFTRPLSLQVFHFTHSFLLTRFFLFFSYQRSSLLISFLLVSFFVGIYSTPSSRCTIRIFSSSSRSDILVCSLSNDQSYRAAVLLSVPEYSCCFISTAGSIKCS